MFRHLGLREQIKILLWKEILLGKDVIFFCDQGKAVLPGCCCGSLNWRHLLKRPQPRGLQAAGALGAAHHVSRAS